MRKMLWAVGLLVAAGVVVACLRLQRSRTSVRPVLTSEMRRRMVQAGVALPAHTVCLYAGNADQHDPRWDPYIWVFYSESAIRLPSDAFMRESADLAGDVTYVEKLAGAGVIGGARTSWGLIWLRGGYRYDGTLIETGRGWYLQICHVRAHPEAYKGPYTGP